MRLLVCFVVGLTAVFAAPTVPSDPSRIVGGSLTTINAYPFAASLLYSWNLVSYYQNCGGSILNNRSILTAAHCVAGDPANRWRVRVSSTWANSGGVVHNTGLIITHPNFNFFTYDNDIALVRTATNIAYMRTVSIPGVNYILADNQPVYAIGWGTTSYNASSPSEQLRHVQIWTVNQLTCRTRYAELGSNITDNMLCAGWLDVGGRDQCAYDNGSPILHYNNTVVVGIRSWGHQCGHPRYPGVSTRVSRYNPWILANA